MNRKDYMLKSSKERLVCSLEGLEEGLARAGNTVDITVTTRAVYREGVLSHYYIDGGEPVTVTTDGATKKTTFRKIVDYGREYEESY